MSTALQFQYFLGSFDSDDFSHAVSNQFIITVCFLLFNFTLFSWNCRYVAMVTIDN